MAKHLLHSSAGTAAAEPGRRWPWPAGRRQRSPLPGRRSSWTRARRAGIDAPHGGAWDFDGKGGYLGIGQAWGDYDNDGRVDLFLAGGRLPSMLYRNNGDGTFAVSEHAADVALAEAWTGGAVWADFDNDGWRDLYVLTHRRQRPVPERGRRRLPRRPPS